MKKISWREIGATLIDGDGGKIAEENIQSAMIEFRNDGCIDGYFFGDNWDVVPDREMIDFSGIEL